MVIEGVVKRAGRRVRKVVLPLVGQPALMSMLEQQQAALAAYENALEAVRKHVSDEIDRLDAYVSYHADMTQHALARATAPVLPLCPDRDTIVLTSSGDLVVPAHDEGLLTFLVRHGLQGVEHGVQSVLASEIRPGDVVVDAGASVGIHAVPMAAAIGPEGRLLCFEPVPRVADALVRTLRLNGFDDRAQVESLALSDRTGRDSLFAAPHSPMSSLVHPDDIRAGQLIDVELSTLDDIVEAGGRVDVLKIDVEGAEPRVWRGMRRVREDNPRLTIVLEWSATHFARSGESATAFMDEIVSDGFTVSVVEEPSGELGPVPDDISHLEEKNLLLRRGR
jgi:FkbM family methyltransferase